VALCPAPQRSPPMSALPTPDTGPVQVPQPRAAALVVRARQVPVQQPALELPRYHESVRRRNRWWTTFSVSEVGQQSFPTTICCLSHKNHHLDHVFPDHEPTSDGFFLGSRSDKDFCRWMGSENTPLHVKNAIVVRVMWWRARKSPLHHQFIVLTVSVSHPKTLNEPHKLYDLRVERVG
jgi:hypothetical protein